jgi:hypothetical protein
MSAQDETIAALLEERRGYVMRGLPDRVAVVDAELARLGHRVAPEAAVKPKAPERATQPKPSRGRKASA